MTTPVSLTSTKMNLGLRQTEQWIDDVLLPRATLLGRLRFCVCLPHPLLAAGVRRVRGTGMTIGAQNVWYEEGAVTGEVSADLLAEVGCTHVMVGHAERRRLFGEDDRLVGRKARAAALAGLTPVICVGEEERCGLAETVARVHQQATTVLGFLPAGAAAVILYEPVWAIGGAQSAEPHQAAAVLDDLHQGAPDHVSLSVLYGGAVTAGTYSVLRRLAPWDGVALGRAAQDGAMLDDVLSELLAAPRHEPGNGR
ncbi:triose-phosphate isomerase [Streptomyces sp. NPDC058783]|uniref:triose-phosphate isomerase n=1 Tax=Streptomyces TaxID=1883 RepID=UPI0021094398|nr:triose-phosphate isomerase family protein [Streptomyces coelicoflavus]MCQ4199023.1 triose-phosphate isomerase [Streptomyces coelicoflavus]